MAVVKIEEATVDMLNWFAARESGISLVDGCVFTKNPEDEQVLFDPAGDIDQATKFIDEINCAVWKNSDNSGGYFASENSGRGKDWFGETLPLAVMRCWAASKKFTHIGIPDSLVLPNEVANSAEQMKKVLSHLSNNYGIQATKGSEANQIIDILTANALAIKQLRAELTEVVEWHRVETIPLRDQEIGSIKSVLNKTRLGVDQVQDEQMYYLANFSHRNGSGFVSWWRPDDKGYTPYLEQAGKYSQSMVDAKPDYYDTETAVPVPVGIVDNFSSPVIDLGHSRSKGWHSAEKLRELIGRKLPKQEMVRER